MVLSRDTRAEHLRCALRGESLNAWCRIPGNPFTGSLSLPPNPDTLPPPSVTYGPLALPEGADTFTFLVQSPGGPRHENTLCLEVEILDGADRALAGQTSILECGDRVPITLSFEPPDDHRAAFRLTVSFEHYAGGDTYGSIRLTYLLAYATNPLVELSNRAGTDKGTEPFVGTGSPHCYAIAYHRLFESLRDQDFRMLEIGLETPSTHTGNTTDAPSLRVWREYFPHAEIHGYDINDFSFFEQERTRIFRGDQSSREDLARFLAEHGGGFRLVIDDGSHASSHQQVSLATLFPSVEPGGIYVIEDLQWQPFAESLKTVDFLRRYIETGTIESPFISEDEIRYLAANIESAEVLKPNDAEIGVIRKKSG